MEELNLTELLRYYLKKLPIIILVTVITVLIGFMYITKVQTPMYHGTTTIILVQKTEETKNSNVTQSDLTLNEKLVTTYSQIMKSRRVIEQVITSLNLSDSYESLKGNITVTSVSETPNIKLTVNNEDADLAVEIANELADVFKNEITKIYNLENISIIDNAILEEKPYNVNLPKQLVISALVGIVTSVGIIFVMYYFDNTIKNKKEIETKLDLAVLGEIPVANKLAALEKQKRRARLSEDTNLDFDSVDEIKKTTKIKEQKEGGK